MADSTENGGAVGSTFDGVLGDASSDDPRLAPEYVRVIDDADGDPVVLVGVVHDHPASVYRTRAVVDAVGPDVVALETPDALVSLFETYAESGVDAGGEMTAAVATAASATVVGVDVPDRRSTVALASAIRNTDASLRTVARTVHGFGRLVAHTARGWLRAAGVPDRLVGEPNGVTQEYDCPPDATPAQQAGHESDHVRRTTTLLRSFDPPPATRILDDARESYMAHRIAHLRTDSSVVAVLGFSHLDAVEAKLSNGRT